MLAYGMTQAAPGLMAETFIGERCISVNIETIILDKRLILILYN